MSGRDPNQNDPDPPDRSPPGDGPGRAPPETPGRGPPEFVKARRAKQAVEDILRRKKHVHAVAVGRKVVRGEVTDEMSIIVHVTDKVPEDEINEEDRIPRRIKVAGKGHVKTDVKETPIPQPESTGTAVPPRWGPHRPVFGGIRLGMEGRGYRGTLGLPVEDNQGRLRLLTNRHVVGSSDATVEPTVGDVVLQPQVDVDDVIGKVEEWSAWTTTGVNTSDSALVSLNAGIAAANHIMSVGPIGPTREPAIGDTCVNSGARTHGVAATVTELDYSGTIAFEPSLSFKGLIVLSPHNTDGGDSGSMWGTYDDATNQVHPVGLNFAGGGSAGGSLAIPWSALEAEHGSLSPPSPGLVSDVSPRMAVNETEVIPYELTTGDRAILKCLATRYGDPAAPTEEPIEVYDGPIVSGEPTGTLIGEYRLTSDWGVPTEIEFRGLIEKLGTGTHTITIYTIRMGPKEYELTITQPTKHRFYGTVTSTSGEIIADASVNAYRQ